MKARSRSPSELDPDQVNVVAACAPPLRAAYTVEVEVALPTITTTQVEVEQEVFTTKRVSLYHLVLFLLQLVQVEMELHQQTQMPLMVVTQQ